MSYGWSSSQRACYVDDVYDAGRPLEFVQNKAPKVTKEDLSPASWSKGKDHEWCPPGHGDLYPALLGSGMLKKLQDVSGAVTSIYGTRDYTPVT